MSADPQDDAQEFAARVVEKLWAETPEATAWDERTTTVLVRFIATELRAGGWRKEPSGEK